jgi:superfamily I DNA/RNA helicase
MVREIPVVKYVEVQQAAQTKPLLFADIFEDVLLGYGVPAEWMDDVRKADEDTVLELADHLPGEAAEALLDLATGVTPQSRKPVSEGIGPFDHPDAQRRFRVVDNVEELERALDYPWEKWTIFLHPDQRQLVERAYSGPARVSGSAGTGKTIVALHRAVFLARSDPDVRVLLTTFSEALANALRAKLRLLISNTPRIGERLEVYAMNGIGVRLYELNHGRPLIASREVIQRLLEKASAEADDHRFSRHFLMTEWEQVVDAWQLETWEEYRDVIRLGRKTRLPEKQRVILWSIFEHVRSELRNEDLLTHADLFSRLATKLSENKRPPFDHIVVDESQDISVAQLRFLAALGTGKPDSLYFAGDLGQWIFQQSFSWKALGVDIRGRSRTLRVNYRTSHQIRKQADRLLGPELSDVDGNAENRRGTMSVFNGPRPTIMASDTREDEIASVSQWLVDRLGEGIMANEIGVFVRSDDELDRARTAVEKAGLPFKILDEKVVTAVGNASISTMHLAKGLEFRAVVVMACDDEVIPLQERIETVADDTDLEEVYNTERHLLYVACTRARDHLLVTGVDPASEFLDDLRV